MALISCKDCGHKVSDRAPTCPQCGRPIAPREEREPQVIKVEQKSSGCALFLVIVLAIIAAVVMLAIG